MKTVGDGVLFTAASAVDAVEIGLRCPTRDAEERPPLRVGPPTVRCSPARRHLLAGGQPGQPTHVARPPGTTLVDRELAQRLRGQSAYRVRPLRRVSVRGYDHLQPWLVRRRPAGEDDNPFESMLDDLADDVLDQPEDDDPSRAADPS